MPAARLLKSSSLLAASCFFNQINLFFASSANCNASNYSYLANLQYLAPLPIPDITNR